MLNLQKCLPKNKIMIVRKGILKMGILIKKIHNNNRKILNEKVVGIKNIF